MPGTRTTQNVGPILGARYPIDADLVSDEVNLNEQDRTASGIVVYKKPQGQGKFEAVVVDAEGNERGVIIGATAAVAHASRHVVEEPSAKESVKTNAGGRSLPSTPKKTKEGNPFATLFDADEFPESSPRPPEYTAQLEKCGVRE